MKFAHYFFAVAATACQASSPQEAPSCSTILKYAQTELPHSGILRNASGFVYVDIDDAYIHKLIALIQRDGFEEPPYFENAGSVGAHITVVYSEEMEQYHVGEIRECGEVIHFTLKNCQVVHPPRWKEIDEVYLIVVEAPELQKIREEYGLPKREHDFHITIGVKPKAAKSA